MIGLTTPGRHGPIGSFFETVRTYTFGRLGGFLLINPRSGDGAPSGDELRDEAAARGLEVHLLQPGDDAYELARRAEADVVGVAGGDGSLALVAQAALDRDVPFVAVPFGTRNHFVRDLGLERDDPFAALDAFVGIERRIDVGRVNDRLFLNNVSLGMYARLVHHRERRRRRREALARVRAVLIALRHRTPRGLTVDGEPVAARVLLVSNNRYVLDLFSLGERESLDDGLLHLYAGNGVLRSSWTERAAEQLTINATAGYVPAAVDGEPERLETPLDFRIDPRALRVLVPPGA
jgi:diacylglycerol kinase family enzyme